jgi:hypothetical protein
MRHLLVPLPISERCSLSEAMDWVQHRAYPVGEEFGFFVQDGTHLLRAATNPEEGFEYWGSAPDSADTREGARDEIFAKLREGRIVATGRYTDAPVDGDEGQAPWPERCWKELDAPETEIPREFWRSRGIDWSVSCARSSEGAYLHVSLPTEALFRDYPEVRATPWEVDRRGDLFFTTLSGKGQAHSPRSGRPPKYDWQEFHVQIALIANSPDGLPERQAELERMMADWCFSKWDT